MYFILTSPENTSLGRLSSGTAAPRTNGNVSEPSTPRSSEPTHINKSNSCIYESHSDVVNGTKRARPKVCEQENSTETIKAPLILLHANNKGADQHTHPQKLISLQIRVRN